MVDDPLAAMRRMRGAAATQTQQSTETHTQTRRQEAPHEEARIVIDMQNNPVAKVMQDKQKSEAEKIKLLAAYLATKDEDYETARKRFVEFESYFTTSQSQDMELSEEAIEKLIDEVRNAANLRIESIVRDLATVQQDAEKIDQMLDALKIANAQGSSVAALRDAVIRNDQIIAEIQAIQDSLTGMKQTKENRAGDKKIAEDNVAASHQGMINSMKRWFGEDKNLMAKLDAAALKLTQIEGEIELRQTALEEKKTQTSQELETPEMKVLKTLDVVEGGFSEAIANTGEHALSLIRGSREAVKQLLLQISQRKEAAGKMNIKVTEAAVRNAVLQGSLQKTEEISRAQSEAIKARLDAKTAEIEAIKDDPTQRVERAVMEADQARIRDLYNQSYAFLENTEHQLTTFATVTSNNTKSEATGRRYSDFLFNVERMFKRLQNEALPEAAQQIEMGLEIDQALKLAGAGQAVGNTIEAARKTAQRNRARLAEVTGEIHVDELKGLGDLTTAIGEAQDELLRAGEATVAHGIKVGDATKRALKAADVLSQMLQEFSALSANAAGFDNGPAGSEPTRPEGGSDANTQDLNHG